MTNQMFWSFLNWLLQQTQGCEAVTTHQGHIVVTYGGSCINAFWVAFQTHDLWRLVS